MECLCSRGGGGGWCQSASQSFQWLEWVLESLCLYSWLVLWAWNTWMVEIFVCAAIFVLFKFVSWVSRLLIISLWQLCSWCTVGNPIQQPDHFVQCFKILHTILLLMPFFGWEINVWKRQKIWSFHRCSFHSGFPFLFFVYASHLHYTIIHFLSLSLSSCKEPCI